MILRYFYKAVNGRLDDATRYPKLGIRFITLSSSSTLKTIYENYSAHMCLRVYNDNCITSINTAMGIILHISSNYLSCIMQREFEGNKIYIISLQSTNVNTKISTASLYTRNLS